MLCVLLCLSMLPSFVLAEELEPPEEIETAVSADKEPEGPPDAELFTDPEPGTGETGPEAQPDDEPAAPEDSQQPEDQDASDSATDEQEGETTDMPAEGQEGEASDLPADPENPEAADETSVESLPETAELFDAASLQVSAFGSEAEGTLITASRSGNSFCLILPASADPSAVSLYFTGCDSMMVTGMLATEELESGTEMNLLQLCGESASGIYHLTLVKGFVSFELEIRFSANFAAMYLTSDDPVNMGRAWVEASPDKSNKATGSMVLQNPDGSLVYNGLLTQIKGRGNTTWQAEKKPYQIKLDTKTDLLETGAKSNKNKTWVLLANAYDPTLLHNAIAYDLALTLGMDAAVEYRFVDLYYDSEYRGSYLLCEKVSVGAGRVDIRNLENENEAANPGIGNLGNLKTARGKTANGATYYYCQGMQSPEDITGGYLLEMEYSARAVSEACYFITSRYYYVVVKSPEYCSKEEMDYIASRYQDFENAVYAGGINKTTGLSLSDYLDLDSAAACYLMNELSKNPDGFYSSAYVYKDSGDDVFHFGPMWDYDISFGYGNKRQPKIDAMIPGWYADSHGIAICLSKVPEFQSAVCTAWADRFAPLLGNVLFGGSGAVSSNGKLRSLLWYEAQTAASAENNYTLWKVLTFNGKTPGGTTYGSNLQYLNTWLEGRFHWIDQNYGAKYGASPGKNAAPQVVPAKTGLMLQWEAVPGAARYAVYYRAGNNKWALAGTTSFSEYRFSKSMKSGTVYSFYVVSRNSAGKPMPGESTAVSAYTYVAPPRLKTAAMIDGGISLTWNAAVGAAGYQVYYMPEGGTWMKGPAVTKTSAQITGLTGSIRYTVAVCSLNQAGEEVSDLSANKKSVVFLATPEIASAEVVTAKTRQLTVNIKPGETPVAGYQVQYCLRSDFRSARPIKATTGGSLSVTFVNPKNGSTYYVRVRSWVKVGSKSYYSLWSEPFSVTP